MNFVVYFFIAFSLCAPSLHYFEAADFQSSLSPIESLSIQGAELNAELEELEDDEEGLVSILPYTINSIRNVEYDGERFSSAYLEAPYIPPCYLS